MSFFCEETNTYLSEKSTEELVSIQKDLNEKQKSLESERLAALKFVRSYDNQVKEIHKNLKIVVDEIKRRKEIEEAKNKISEDIKNIEGFELLRECELSIITTKMDITDYRKYGRYPRYLDLERICKEVIDMKKKYPKWTLASLSKRGQVDTLPPHTFYKYEYKDENNHLFSNGGTQIL